MSYRVYDLSRNVRVLVASMVLLCGAVGIAAEPAERPADEPKIDAQALAIMIQSFDKVEVEKHPWGWIRWLMSAKLDPKAKMTFGLVKLNAGQRNPMHIHPNCEEVLYVLAGSCEHVLGKHTVTLKEGDVIRIPKGVPHKAMTSEKESMTAVIVYSSGDRQFKVVDE